MKTILITIFLVATSFAQDAVTCSSIEKTQSSLLSAVRTINTAEVTYKFQVSKTKSYASLDSLMRSEAMQRLLQEDLKKMPGDFQRLQNSADDPLPGFDVKLILSADGQHYSLSVLKKKGGDCSFVGLSSSDTGIIYRTMAIDYAAPTTAALQYRSR